MKRSTKLISLLLAVLMIAALLPTAALADDADTQSIGDTVGSVVDTVNGIKPPHLSGLLLPDEQAACKRRSGHTHK